MYPHSTEVESNAIPASEAGALLCICIGFFWAGLEKGEAAPLCGQSTLGNVGETKTGFFGSPDRPAEMVPIFNASINIEPLFAPSDFIGDVFRPASFAAIVKHQNPGVCASGRNGRESIFSRLTIPRKNRQFVSYDGCDIFDFSRAFASIAQCDGHWQVLYSSNIVCRKISSTDCNERSFALNKSPNLEHANYAQNESEARYPTGEPGFISETREPQYAPKILKRYTASMGNPNAKFFISWTDILFILFAFLIPPGFHLSPRVNFVTGVAYLGAPILL